MSPVCVTKIRKNKLRSIHKDGIKIFLPCVKRVSWDIPLISMSKSIYCYAFIIISLKFLTNKLLGIDMAFPNIVVVSLIKVEYVRINWSHCCKRLAHFKSRTTHRLASHVNE